MLSSEFDSEFEEDIEKQLGEIDFSKLDNIVNNLDEKEKNAVNSSSFFNIVKNFIFSENSYSFKELLSYIFSNIFVNITKNLPSFVFILVISLLFSIISNSNFIKSDGTKKIVSFVCTGAISTIVFKIVFSSLKAASTTINSVANILELLLPIILTLIVSIGGVNTASVFQPTLAILCNGVTKLFSLVLVPLFIFSIIFNIVGCLQDNVKLEKFSKFTSSLFKSIIGVVFTIFVAFITLQGLSSSIIDGISIKTAKYALKNYIPILGSYLSDGINIILLSTGIIKNAIGVAGLFVVIFIVLKPILEILILTLLFKFFSAILEIFSDNHSKLLYDVSKSLGMLNLCLIAVGVMSLISVSILLSVSNIV